MEGIDQRKRIPKKKNIHFHAYQNLTFVSCTEQILNRAAKDKIHLVKIFISNQQTKATP